MKIKEIRKQQRKAYDLMRTLPAEYHCASVDFYVTTRNMRCFYKQDTVMITDATMKGLRDWLCELYGLPDNFESEGK